MAAEYRPDGKLDLEDPVVAAGLSALYIGSKMLHAAEALAELPVGTEAHDTAFGDLMDATMQYSAKAHVNFLLKIAGETERG